MIGRTAKPGAGLPDSDQVEPFDEAAYVHQLRLFKSMHCARPVLHRGLNRFITCLTVTGTGSRLDMTVYLAGVLGSVDCAEVQIKQIHPEGSTA